MFQFSNVKKIFLFLVCVFGFLFFIFDFCQGAILYLNPASGDYHQGDTFMVEIKLDTEGEYINAVEANLIFSSDILEVQDLSQGNSVLTLWVKEPGFSGNKISFLGGVPGGYQGADGLLGKIIFQVLESGQGTVRINFQDDSRVLLNDGKGTEAKLTIQEAKFNIIPGKLETPGNKWEEELEKDKTPPQSFKIEISQNPAIFDGKYFITFSTTDKETGVDYYEVKEEKWNWEKAVSPYALKNQRLTDDIWVKAVDKAGNEWMEIIKATRKPIWEYILYGVLFLILLLGIIKAGKRIRKL